MRLAQTLEAYIKKINRYAGYAAQELIKKNIKIGWIALYIKPAYKFLHNYIIRGGVLDGKNGWIICSLRAKEVWLRAKKAKQLNVIVKPSTNKAKKIDVFDKYGNTI